MNVRCTVALLGLIVLAAAAAAAEPQPKLVLSTDLFTPLTEPPCSYCSTQHRKRLIEEHDPVIAWIRGAHNGGAIPRGIFSPGRG
jgi:hypothetical protein